MRKQEASPKIKLIAFVIWFISGLNVYAQDDAIADSLNSRRDSIAEKSFFLPVGIYLEGNMTYAPTPPDQYNYFSEFGFGIAYNRWSAGIYQSFFLGEISGRLIFPNSFNLLFTHGGGYVGFNFIKLKSLEVGLYVNYCKGDMVWEYSETNKDLARDEFQFLKPEIQVNYIPWKFVKAYVELGYIGYLEDIELPGVSNEDFSGLTMSAGLKIGYFARTK